MFWIVFLLIIPILITILILISLRAYIKLYWYGVHFCAQVDVKLLWVINIPAIAVINSLGDGIKIYRFGKRIKRLRKNRYGMLPLKLIRLKSGYISAGIYVTSADKAAEAYGLLWALLGTVSGITQNRLRCDVYFAFDRNALEIDFFCIIGIAFDNIIYVLKKLKEIRSVNKNGKASG